MLHSLVVQLSTFKNVILTFCIPTEIIYIYISIFKFLQLRWKTQDSFMLSVLLILSVFFSFLMGSRCTVIICLRLLFD